MNADKQKRIEEIEERINNLREHRAMWGRAGGVGGKMAMQAVAEIEELELEKEDLLNGTNKLEIYRIQKRITQLKLLREQANILKKLHYNSEIKKAEEQLKSLK